MTQWQIFLGHGELLITDSYAFKFSSSEIFHSLLKVLCYPNKITYTAHIHHDHATKLAILVLCKDGINNKVTIMHSNNVRHFTQIAFAIQRNVSLAMYFRLCFQLTCAHGKNKLIIRVRFII